MASGTVPGLRRADGGAGSGVIVNIGSISGYIVNRPQMQPAYNALKAAVHHLTKSLAAEWAPYGVRPRRAASSARPCPRSTSRVQRYGRPQPQQRAPAAPEEIAPAVLYLAVVRPPPS